jgi:hypothetical protein
MKQEGALTAAHIPSKNFKRKSPRHPELKKGGALNFHTQESTIKLSSSPADRLSKNSAIFEGIRSATPCQVINLSHQLSAGN